MPSTEPKHPTVGAPPSEIAPLICAVAIEGPPVVFVVAPWLILGLALSGPFVVVLTLVAALAAATALLAGVVAMFVLPLVALRRRRTRPVIAGATVDLRRVAA